MIAAAKLAIDSDLVVSRIAAAIGEPARIRMLHALLDGHARTSTELAVLAEVSPSTASVHLHRLERESLIEVYKQGKHRYYSLGGPEVARALEALSVVAGRPATKFVPSTPTRLQLARTCYDHIAGRLGVAIHNQFRQMRWLVLVPDDGRTYDISGEGAKKLRILGIDVDSLRGVRRKFAYPCVDWSERQPHIGGALGAGLLAALNQKKWIARDLDSRALTLTRLGEREIMSVLGVTLNDD